MSRLGRNYLEVGQLTETVFPTYNVHFIAVNDGVDSERGEDDFTPFRNIMNEWYAKDMSRKMRSSLRTKSNQGYAVGQPPFGYMHDPENRKRWVIDPEGAEVVRHSRKKRMEPGEYQAGLRGDSWKLELVFVLNQALREAEDKESFIEWLEREGYQVRWSANSKHITFITPEGYRCRDSSLHDETFLKDNLEYLFLYRQLTNFEPGREEPSYGWLYGVTYNAEALIRYMAQAMDVPDPPPIPVWTESKQRQREALKKLAHGQRLENIESFEEDEDYGFGMSM